MKLKAGSLVQHRDGDLYLIVKSNPTGEPTGIINLTHCIEIGKDPNWLDGIENGSNSLVTVLDGTMIDIIKRITNE